MLWNYINWNKRGESASSDEDTLEVIDEFNNKKIKFCILNFVNENPKRFLLFQKINKEIINTNIKELAHNRNFIYEFKERLHKGIVKRGFYTYKDYKKSFNCIINKEIKKKYVTNLQILSRIIDSYENKNKRLNILFIYNIGLGLSLLCYLINIKINDFNK